MNNTKVFGSPDEKSQIQIDKLIDTGLFDHIRIMPDVHAGNGAVIGFTAKANINKGLIVNVIGSDVGCGVVAYPIGKELPFDLTTIDQIIRKVIPLGYHNTKSLSKQLRDKYHIEHLSYYEHRITDPLFGMLSHIFGEKSDKTFNVYYQLGTLGGGNHFIEIAKSERTNNYWLLVHSGSRNVGLSIANHFQNIAIKLHEWLGTNVEKDLCWLPSKVLMLGLQQNFFDYANQYLRNQITLVEWAKCNRRTIVSRILSELGMDYDENFLIESIHNYIEYNDKDIWIRKGAISAYHDQKVVIPMNMAWGTIIGRGLGNHDWNYSAPHGAGRLMSRTQAKKEISVEDMKRVMSNVINTDIDNCIDESPQAYKNPDNIIEYLNDTIEIQDRLIPVLNIKGNENKDAKR